MNKPPGVEGETPLEHIKNAWMILQHAPAPMGLDIAIVHREDLRAISNRLALAVAGLERERRADWLGVSARRPWWLRLFVGGTRTW